jgi:hypothetical protein
LPSIFRVKKKILFLGKIEFITKRYFWEKSDFSPNSRNPILTQEIRFFRKDFSPNSINPIFRKNRISQIRQRVAFSVSKLESRNFLEKLDFSPTQEIRFFGKISQISSESQEIRFQRVKKSDFLEKSDFSNFPNASIAFSVSKLTVITFFSSSKIYVSSSGRFGSLIIPLRLSTLRRY